MRTASDGLLALPDATDPCVTLEEDRHGRWTLEVDGNARLAVDHERIHAQGIWTLRIPPFEVITLRDYTHHEVLLALARARRADQETGLPTSEQGWTYVDDLLDMLKLDMLKLDIKRLNVNIFRARQHLARVRALDVGTLIERRSTTRQIRLGIAVEIVQS